MIIVTMLHNATDLAMNAEDVEITTTYGLLQHFGADIAKCNSDGSARSVQACSRIADVLMGTRAIRG